MGAELAIFKDVDDLETVSARRKAIHVDGDSVFLGLSGKLYWVWSDGNNLTQEAWVPRGDGKCGSFVNATNWRWSDIRCDVRLGYICEQPLGTSL